MEILPPQIPIIENLHILSANGKRQVYDITDMIVSMYALVGLVTRKIVENLNLSLM